MKRKIRTLIIMSMLLSVSIVVIIDKNADVVATSGGGGSGGSIGLDAYGDVLVCDDDSLLEATYEFTVNI
jgi:hypothetical protein